MTSSNEKDKELSYSWMLSAVDEAVSDESGVFQLAWTDTEKWIATLFDYSGRHVLAEGCSDATMGKAITKMLREYAKAKQDEAEDQPSEPIEPVKPVPDPDQLALDVGTPKTAKPLVTGLPPQNDESVVSYVDPHPTHERSAVMADYTREEVIPPAQVRYVLKSPTNTSDFFKAVNAAQAEIYKARMDGAIVGYDPLLVTTTSEEITISFELPSKPNGGK